MKIKTNPNKRQRGDSFEGFILFILLMMGVFVIGVVVGSTDDSRGSKVDRLKKDAVAHGFAHYSLNLDTLKPEFQWNVNTNK